MAAKTTKKESPNSDIDDAIKGLMKQIKQGSSGLDDPMPPDVAVKIINTAIAWERVKHHIIGADDFDPETI